MLENYFILILYFLGFFPVFFISVLFMNGFEYFTKDTKLKLSINSKKILFLLILILFLCINYVKYYIYNFIADYLDSWIPTFEINNKIKYGSYTLLFLKYNVCILYYFFVGVIFCLFIAVYYYANFLNKSEMCKGFYVEKYYSHLLLIFFYFSMSVFPAFPIVILHLFYKPIGNIEFIKDGIIIINSTELYKILSYYDTIIWLLLIFNVITVAIYFYIIYSLLINYFPNFSKFKVNEIVLLKMKIVLTFCIFLKTLIIAYLLIYPLPLDLGLVFDANYTINFITYLFKTVCRNAIVIKKTVCIYIHFLAIYSAAFFKIYILL